MSPRRIVDVAVAGIALMLFAPVLAILALAVRVTSPGPALFRQVRVGCGGRPFVLLKLRTMWEAASGPRVTGTADARVTPLGGWLRRWKLDELPQLLNVLRGDMTLIGPRPEVPEYLGRLGPAGRDYVAVRPGLADAATVEFYDEAEMLAGASDPERVYVERILPEKARLSIVYARGQTLASDLRLVWMLLANVDNAEADLPQRRSAAQKIVLAKTREAKVESVVRLAAVGLKESRQIVAPWLGRFDAEHPGSLRVAVRLERHFFRKAPVVEQVAPDCADRSPWRRF